MERAAAGIQPIAGLSVCARSRCLGDDGLGDRDDQEGEPVRRLARVVVMAGERLADLAEVLGDRAQLLDIERVERLRGVERGDQRGDASREVCPLLLVELAVGQRVLGRHDQCLHLLLEGAGAVAGADEGREGDGEHEHSDDGTATERRAPASTIDCGEREAAEQPSRGRRLLGQRGADSRAGAQQLSLLGDRDARGLQEQLLKLRVERLIALPAAAQEIRQPHRRPPRTLP